MWFYRVSGLGIVGHLVFFSVILRDWRMGRGFRLGGCSLGFRSFELSLGTLLIRMLVMERFKKVDQAKR